ncbi:hypothetical protein D0B54_11680 [Solimonas sp. K1W22B-7]|uniref:hypothetical protein n=1 Tax=Solimonas sp. K1W22B-7 TaxID=2303331 RepID=UPI000E3328AE|nr:hypothetical protein [Solimonas sp. K1W22B-7]AXQ29309.1 hypothetical protein D0B54_11680 [Solimonas sp. K1W22B-7]
MTELNGRFPRPVPGTDQAESTGEREPWVTPTLRVLAMPQTKGSGKTSTPTPMEGTMYGPS